MSSQEDSAAERRGLTSLAQVAVPRAVSGRGGVAEVAKACRDRIQDEVEVALGERSVPAVVVGTDHRIRGANQRCRALFDGVPLLGRFCYEVFHRRREPCDPGPTRCPVHRWRETGEPCRAVHVHCTARGEEHHEITVRPLVVCDRSISCLELRPIAVASARPRRPGLVGRSGAFNRMLELMLRAAPRSTPVLLIGETGTGKESVARALHELGRGPRQAFVYAHCAGFAGGGFGRELLGPDLAGAAAGRAPGKIEAARGGTLFLAEVGALTLADQGELLRLLGGRALGRSAFDDRSAPDFRLICGTDPGLRERVAQGAFLADLYYRISAFPIEVPPLRQRRADLALLAECQLEQLEHARRLEIHPRTLSILERHPLPGNLRELRQIIEYASLQVDGGEILPDHLPESCRAGDGWSARP